MQEIGLEKNLEEIYANPAYKTTKELCFINMVDEQTPEEKQTIAYLTDPKNFDRLTKRLMRSKRLDQATAGDIMIDVYDELSRKEDYQLMWDEKDPTKIIPIEGYVNHIINICLKRYFSKEAKIKSHELPNIVSNSTVVEEDLFDLIPDNSTSELLETYEYDLDAAIEWATGHRYIGNCDLFSIIYVRMITNNSEAFKRILRLTGVTPESESQLENWLRKDEEALYFLKSVVSNGERSIKTLEKHVYGAKLIKKAISASA